MALIHSRVVFNHEEEQICPLQGSGDHLVKCRVGRKGEVMKVEAGLSENRKGIHGEGQMWVIGR